MKLLKQFIQQETVLTAAAVLAVVSAFFVPPDAPDFQAPFRAVPLMGRDRRNTRTVLYRSRSVQDGI